MYICTVQIFNNNNNMNLTKKEFETLTREQFTKLHNEYKKTGSIKLRNKLVTANIKLVRYIASNKARYNTEIDDLVSCGIIGLISAIERFDADTNNKFSVFAADWINHEIRLFLDDTNKTVRLPKNQRVKVAKLNKMARLYENDINLAVDEYNSSNSNKINKSELAYITSVFNHNTSSIYSTDDDGKNYLNPDLADKIDVTTNADYNLLSNESNAEILLLLKKILTQQELLVITMRFGINYEYMLRMGDIAKRLKVSPITVKKLYTSGLNKLKENKSIIN